MKIVQTIFKKIRLKANEDDSDTLEFEKRLIEMRKRFNTGKSIDKLLDGVFSVVDTSDKEQQ